MAERGLGKWGHSDKALASGVLARWLSGTKWRYEDMKFGIPPLVAFE